MENDEKDLKDELKLLKSKIDRYGLKWTKRREELAQWIFSNHDHFTVEDIIRGFQKLNKKMPPATIYRFVQTLLDLGLLIEHHFNENMRHYEHVPGHPHHDHLICKSCGKIQEFMNKDIEELQEKIAIQFGFTLESHTLNLYGLCDDCKKKKSAP